MSKKNYPFGQETNISTQCDKKISIIGICSSLQGFVLADKINRFFNFSLQRNKNFNSSLECFYFHSLQHQITLLLIANQFFDKEKMPYKSLKNTDYFFVIIGRDHATVCKDFLEKLRVFPVSKRRNQTKNNFLDVISSNIEGINMLQTKVIYTQQDGKKTILNNFIQDCLYYKEEIIQKQNI
ncbi:MAG: hypothetical protein LBR17_02900 [Bacteroidales bacterium]|jgi:hypothetical protein|nr:hypothetical protein [Bacteroidales bacterium]